MSHTSLFILRTRLTHAHTQVRRGAKYYHHKNPFVLYKVIDIGLREDTEKSCVIYSPISDPKMIWIRDVDNWCEKVGSVNRFTKV